MKIEPFHFDIHVDFALQEEENGNGRTRDNTELWKAVQVQQTLKDFSNTLELGEGMRMLLNSDIR